MSTLTIKVTRRDYGAAPIEWEVGMRDTFSIRLDGSEVARVSGEGITCAKKWNGPELMGGEFVDDPNLLKLVRDGKTILVFYVSKTENVTVEKVSE